MIQLLKSLPIAFLLCLFALDSVAQISHGGQPRSWQFEDQTSDDVQAIHLPAIDIEQLLEEDAQTSKSDAFRFGHSFPVQHDLQSSGTWTELENGDRIWRLKIKCKSAASINLLYEQFFLPLGSKFHVYSEDHEQLLGAFIHANNKEHGKFATGLINGTVCIIEYFEPSAVRDQGVIQVSKVVHGYRDYRTGFDQVSRGYTDSGSCNNNVQCPEAADWQSESKAVAMILFEGFRLCTGAMVNNTSLDCTPYFLSANHCYTPGETQQWMFMFNYESPVCNNQNGPTNQSVVSCEVKARNSLTDFLLLELSMEPPADYNVHYAGWSKSLAAASSAVGIHHPAGDIKKISFDEDNLINEFPYWRVGAWEDGTTEGGSSGSPIFDQNHRIVGQLQGGNASCGNSNGSDYYGQFHESWIGNGTTSGSLSIWLDPSGGDSDFLDGMDCAVKTNDAAITTIIRPTETFCSTSITPRVVILNEGTAVIESMEIVFSLDGQAGVDTEWEGSINPGQSGIVPLTNIQSTLGQHNIIIDVIKVNGGEDQRGINDLVELDFQIVAGPNFETCVLPPTQTQAGIVSIQSIIAIQPFNMTIDGVATESGSAEVQAGSYFAVVQDGNACKKTNSFEVIESLSSCTESVIDLSEVFCFADDAEVSWDLPGSNQETSQELYPQLVYNTAGTYDIILTLNGQLRLYSSFITVEESFSFELTTNSTGPGANTSNAKIVLQNIEDYEVSWTNIDSEELSVFGLTEGQYAVSVKDLSSGCAITKAFEISATDQFSYPDQAGFFPNPATMNLHFYNSFDDVLSIEIFDLAGRELLLGSSTQGISNLDISQLPAGIYVLKLTGTNFEKIEKLYVYK